MGGEARRNSQIGAAVRVYSTPTPVSSIRELYPLIVADLSDSMHAY
jgi:hypothetical protein